MYIKGSSEQTIQYEYERVILECASVNANRKTQVLTGLTNVEMEDYLGT